MTPLRLEDAPRLPWRNGAGTTRELLAWPPGGDWRVRVSVADIAADGAFSPYPGVRRWFAVLAGAGVELTFDAGAPQRVRRGDAPLAFDGAVPVHCRLLDGPTLDLNLMLRGLPGRLLAAAGAPRWRPAGAHCGLFTAAAGRCNGSDVPAHALLWFERAPAQLDFEPAHGWWIDAGAAPAHSS